MNTNITTVLELPHVVNTNEVDLLQNITLPAVLHLFQDLATQHADILGFGYEDFAAKDQFWALSRIHIEIEELAKWKSPLRMQTWTNGVNGIFANRNWAFFAEEQKLISGFADWLILNFKTRRPVRPDFGDFENKTFPELATESKTIKIDIDDEMELIDGFKVRINELDMHEHVNNVYYFAWIINALGLEWKKKYFPSVIDINYLKEIRYPAYVKIFTNADKSVFSIRDEDEKTEYSRVRITWKPFQ